VHRHPVPGTLEALRPWYGATGDAEAVFSSVASTGHLLSSLIPDPAAVDRQVAELGRSIPLGPAQDLLAGGGIGRLRLFEKGTASREADFVRVVSEPGRRVELHGPHARAARLRFRYRADGAKSFVVRLRAGTREVNFQLPLDEPGRWRDVDAVALEGAHAVTIDGAYRLASAEDDGSATMDGLLRWSVRDGAVSMKDATFEPIQGLPEEPLWTNALPAQAPPGWTLEEGALVGSGKFAIPQAAPHFDLEVLAVSRRGARLELSKNNVQVFVSERYPLEGETVGVTLQVRAFKVGFLETRLFDEVKRSLATSSLQKGPLELHVHDGPMRILELRTRARE
jgi:hypothetical protein